MSRFGVGGTKMVKVGTHSHVRLVLYKPAPKSDIALLNQIVHGSLSEIYRCMMLLFSCSSHNHQAWLHSHPIQSINGASQRSEADTLHIPFQPHPLSLHSVTKNNQGASSILPINISAINNQCLESVPCVFPAAC